jgi:glycosyltransferase involved in cell wall biosynthesis
MALRVLHLSSYATNGGAARAASALNHAMQRQGIDSRMITGHGPRFTVARTLDRQLWRLQSSPTRTWRSPARFASITAHQINRSSADVVNLHWVTDGFLSIEEIGRITKPIVWSMYDMWPFTGTEHYGTDTRNARWRTGYTKQNRSPDEQGFDLDRWTFERKQRHWEQEGTAIHMVPASTWLEQATRSSALMGDWPITRIPHVVDTDVFAPMSKEQARQRLRLPHKAPLILFLASAGITDQRKGFDLLEKALPSIASQHPGLELVIAGPTTPDYRPPAGITVHWLGHLEGDDALRTAYGASDVLAAPSREDNMPLTAMEAQSCGRSVVAFNIGGLPDIVEHRTTGYLATPGDTADLATGLTSMLHDAREGDVAGILARARAQVTWSPAVIVHRYRTIYESVLT